jgi:hypothetical protein
VLALAHEAESIADEIAGKEEKPGHAVPPAMRRPLRSWPEMPRLAQTVPLLLFNVIAASRRDRWRHF